MQSVFRRLGIPSLALILISGTALAKEVDFAKLNPAFKNASFVNDSGVCYGCHQDSKKHFEETAHAKAFRKKVPDRGECESCHGPRSLHVENPTKEHALNVTQQASACLQCHEGADRKFWKSSAHASEDVGCASCHTVMSKKSERNLLAKPTERDTCYTCHTNVRGELNKSSHHPVREGKLSCSGCHNAHGSLTPGMLKGTSINDTCFKCHQEKRGPFVWEHAPVRENCLNCHEAHGSNNRKLQNGKDSFVCLQCHTYGGHINLPRYNRTSNPYGEGCVNCHMTIHGSNSPSGAKFTR